MSSGGRDRAIAVALADVARAAQKLVDGRVELLRLEAREDASGLMAAAAYGGAALVAVSVAIVSGAATIAWTLALWIPIGAAFGVATAACGVTAIVLVYLTRKKIPGPKVPVAALPAETEREP